MTHTYNITGMTCQSCVGRVRSQLLQTAGILSADIKLDAPQATISMEKHIPLPKLQEAVSKAGHYKISETADAAMPHIDTTEETTSSTSYYPIFLIFGYIIGVTLLLQWQHGSFDWMHWMQHFMAGFFLVFSFFKLMNLKGFAEGYRTYDVVAKAVPAWGFIYPFVELALGIAYLTGIYPLGTNLAALLVMGTSTIGVVQSLLQRRPFQCACLGTVFKLPLSKVTLVEDLLMVAMSGTMVYQLML
jgi:copper chaperone CopZ